MRNIFTLVFLSTFIFPIGLRAQEGQLDQTFGAGNGMRIADNIPGVINQEKQRIMVGKGSYVNYIYHSFSISPSDGAPGDFGIARYDPDGQLDPGFNGTGYRQTNIGGDDAATSLAVQQDGKIVVAGYSRNTTTGNSVIAVARYNQNGLLDATFNSGGATPGVVTTAVGASSKAYWVLIQNDNKIVVGGYGGAANNPDFALVRYSSAGVPDNTFGSLGIVTTAIGPGTDIIYSLGLQSDGKIVAAGYSTAAAGNNMFALARYTTTGGLDVGAFNSAGSKPGTVTTSIGGLDDEAQAVTFEFNGNIIAGGFSNMGTATVPDYDFALVRYKSNGTLNTSFDGDGIVTTDILGEEDKGMTLGYQIANRKIILGGFSFNGLDHDFSVIRYDSTGAPDASFGPNGDGTNVIDFNPASFPNTTGSEDYAYSLTAQGSNIVLGGISGSSLAVARLINSAPIILPVHISDLTATRQGNTVQLNWQTALEENTFAFEVQRSSDGQNFARLGEVAAAGSSKEARDYAFTDTRPLSGPNMYRLRIIDIDGKESFSKIVTVRFDAAVTLQAFPNPVRSVLNLQVKAPRGPLSVQLFDATGRLVKALQVSSPGGTISVPIDMSGLVRGAYILRAGDESLSIIKE